jgi:predicted O-linked N-acetylglucosamine transferase (SPINDLY family)
MSTQLHPLLNVAFAHLQRGAGQEALDALKQVLAAEPNNAAAHFLNGRALYVLDRKKDALRHFDRAVALQPQFTDAVYNRGVLQAELGLLKQAEASLKQALAQKPTNFAVYANLGAVLAQLGRPEDAVAAYSKYLERQPQDAKTFFNRGTVRLKLEQYHDAIADFQAALAVQPNYVAAWSNLAGAFQQIGGYNDAVQCAQKALSHDAAYFPAHMTLIYALSALKQFDQALVSADKAVTLSPDEAEAHAARGDVLRALHRYDHALKSYEVAVTLKPKHGPYYVVRGDAYAQLQQLDKAAADYAAAAVIDPYAHFSAGYALETYAKMCDWPKIAALMPVMRKGIARGFDVAAPFATLIGDFTAQEQLQCARNMSARYVVAAEALKARRHEKIRIGYFSPDFGPHAVSYLMAGVLEAHDRTQFEVFGFSYGPVNDGEMFQRLKASCDQFFDVGSTSDRDVSALAQDLKLDVAIDLAGYTGRGRAGIFAHRAAPVQVNYLGYSATTGAPYMDYIIVDDVIAPPGCEGNFSEKLVRLPETFQPNDAKRPYGMTAARADFGLADGSFVFCAFNSAYKINQATFEAWLEILKKVDGSVLWLTDNNIWQTQNLKAAAISQGVAPERLIFAPKVASHAAHLSRYQLADLFLDALPYNAHTTASDALWMGLPVLTCTGETFASRVAASLLSAIDTPQLITNSRADFVDLAVVLANDPERLKQIRDRIAANRLTSPLFDTARFTRHLENAFAMMSDRAVQGVAPDHIRVPQI